MKIRGPLFSESVSGTIANVLTFSKRASGQQCRFQKKQAYLLTEAREEMKVIFLGAVSAWNSLTDEQKNEYNTRAKNLNYTGYDLFIKENFNVLPAVYGVDVYGVGVY